MILARINEQELMRWQRLVENADAAKCANDLGYEEAQRIFRAYWQFLTEMHEKYEVPEDEAEWTLCPHTGNIHDH